MYSDLKNVQILVALLKKYGVKHIVLSAGTRHTPFVYSVEHDDFFHTYSIVDERSASFFAIGLIEKLREPVAICCTSGTAAANYVSAANEAFYQQLPLLILTADRNHYYMFQQEEQMIPQEGLYSSVCKKVVTLPHVRDEKDFWYCSRICNEALLELYNGELGPVHINFIVENDYPIVQGIVKFETAKLPDIKKINKLTLEDDEKEWKKWASKLRGKKVLIIYGQYCPITKEEIDAINCFADRYDCVISVDMLSNLHVKKGVYTFNLGKVLTKEELANFVPDILITMNANSMSEIKGRMGAFKTQFEHWHVSAKGEVSDPYKMLSDTIMCSPKIFFKRFADLAQATETTDSYYEQWKNAAEKIGVKGNLNDEVIPYSAVYATQQFIKNIPQNSLLHLANSNSVRLANFFKVHESVNVYGNRGAHGIDGSMSAFVGQASASEELCFLLIGDLSFFYDMNALWNQYIGNNIRIMVCNNSGGAIFHTYPNLTNVPSLDEHIAAEHHTSVKGWVEARGFTYMKATSKEEITKQMPAFVAADSEKPILMEVFTDKEEDSKGQYYVIREYLASSNSLKHKVGKMMPEGLKSTLKNIIK